MLFTSIGGKLPTKKHPTDAGFDLYALDRNAIGPNSSAVVGTGVRINLTEIDWRCVGLIMAKSRSDYIVGAGVVDQGYTGELMVRIFNPFNRWLVIEKGTPLAQILVVQLIHLEHESVEEGERGATGGILGYEG
jgi:dUTP pyrophosphatase